MTGDDHTDSGATLWLVGITFSATSQWESPLVTLKCERDRPRLVSLGHVCPADCVYLQKSMMI